jgi:hypothetical protein
MKYLVFVLALLSIILTAQQPEPLIQNNIKIQPIVENLDMGEDYWYIQTVKVYYKDTLGFKPIYLRKGPPLDSRCSDETKITFISKKDSLTVKSIKRMSCEIIAYFNLNSYEVNWLKSKMIDKIIIFNVVTDNSYMVYINDVSYLNSLLNKYNVKNH